MESEPLRQGRHMGKWMKAWPALLLVGLVTGLAAASGCGDQAEPTGPQAGIDPCEAMQQLETYRYAVELQLESPEPSQSSAEPGPTPTADLIREYGEDVDLLYQIQASFQAPDRTEALITVATGQASMIVVGDNTWVLSGSQWRAEEVMRLPYRPPDVCLAMLPGLDFSTAEPQKETKNDVDTVHYHFAAVHSEKGAAHIFGYESDMAVLLKQFDIDVWLAEDGQWPARMELRSSGLYGDGRELHMTMFIDLMDVNSDEIQVEPPA